MNAPLAFAALVAPIFFSMMSNVRAESFTINAETFTAPETIIRQAGFDWAFLPHKQPFDPKNPRRRPFDSMRPMQGVFTPDKMAVVRRALSGDRIKERELISRSAEAETQVRVAAKDGKDGRAISVSVSALAEGKIRVKVAGSDPSVFQEASIASGDTIILSFAGKEAGSVEIHFIQIKNG